MGVDTFELADLLRHRDRIADVIAVVEAAEEFLGQTSPKGDTAERRKIRDALAALPQQPTRPEFYCSIDHAMGHESAAGGKR